MTASFQVLHFIVELIYFSYQSHQFVLVGFNLDLRFEILLSFVSHLSTHGLNREENLNQIAIFDDLNISRVELEKLECV